MVVVVMSSTCDDVIARQSKQLSVVMENLKFEFCAIINFFCKEVLQQRKFMIDCVPCTGTVHRLTAQLPDSQMSLGVDVSWSKMTRGLAGRPSDAVNTSVTAAVEKPIRDDRRSKVLEM